MPSSSVGEKSFSLSDLRAAIQGRIITPDAADYDQARTLFYGGFEKRPAVIVRVANDADVARVITLARETGLPLAVRSGGHSNAGQSVCEGGIVLDLGDMKALTIDAEARTAWAETGLTAAEYLAAAGAHGLATGFGDTGSVGLGGITLGGGVGYLVRKYGLTIDNVLAADIVTASGHVRRIDAQILPDLFWAIRGGGGNFGVVTRFQFRLHPVDPFVGGLLLLPATPAVIAGFVGAADAAPDELSAIANIMPAPPMPFVPAEQHGKLVILALMAYVGAVEAGQQALAPFRALAAPLADMVGPMPYVNMFPPEDAAYHPTAIGRNFFLEGVDLAAARTIVDYLNASDASMRVTQLRVLGGALARVPAAATAFAHRQSKIMANVAAFYTGPEDLPRRERWVADFTAALRQQNTGAYVNFLADEDSARVREAYPTATWERLRAVKARYDPDNLFRLNQNIPPAGAG